MHACHRSYCFLDLPKKRHLSFSRDLQKMWVQGFLCLVMHRTHFLILPISGVIGFWKELLAGKGIGLEHDEIPRH